VKGIMNCTSHRVS